MADDPNLNSFDDEALKNAQAVGDSMVEARDAARQMNQELRASGQLAVNFANVYAKVTASANAVAKIQEQAKISSKAVESATKEQIKNLTAVRELNTKIDDLYSRARKETGAVKEQLLAQAKNLETGRTNAQTLADLYGNIADDAARLNSKTAFFSTLSNVVKDIPGLRAFSGPFEAAAKAARETVIANAKNGTTVSVMGKGMKAFASSAASSAASFLKSGGWIGLVATGLKKAWKFLMEIDERTAETAGNLNMSKTQAADLNRNIVRASKGMDYFTGRIGEGSKLMGEFANTTGIIATNLEVFNGDLGVINRRFGLSSQQTSEMAKNMLIAGQGSTEFAVSALGAAEALEMQSGISIQNQAIMKDIANLTATQFLNLKGQPEAMAKAVTQARRFGMTMSLIEGSQSSLLNFSESITDEMNAELLLGRQLNLDRARLAALNNDYGTVAAEVAKQIGTAADFSKMNYFQQQALAKAVGMTRDELAKTLKEQEALEKAGFASADAREKEYQRLKKIYGQQEALRRIGMAEFTRQKNNISFQEKLNNLIENMKVIFTDSIAPVLERVLENFMKNKDAVNGLVEGVKGFALKISDAITDLQDGTGIIGRWKAGFKLIGALIKASLVKPIEAAWNAGKSLYYVLMAGGAAAGGNFGTAKMYWDKAGEAGAAAVAATAESGILGTTKAYIDYATEMQRINDKEAERTLERAERDKSKTLAETASSKAAAAGKNISQAEDSSTKVVAKNEKSTTKENQSVRPTKTAEPSKQEFKSTVDPKDPNAKTNMLLEKLIYTVEKGGNVYLDGRKVGESLVINTVRQ